MIKTVLSTSIATLVLLASISTAQSQQRSDILRPSPADTNFTQAKKPLFPDPFFNEKLDNKAQRFTTSKAFQITYIPVGLFAIAGIEANNDDYVKQSRTYNLPTFRYHYDDYLQYFPGVLTYTLKAFGVESRSSWQLLLTSSLFSTAIMASTVNVAKTKFIRCARITPGITHFHRDTPLPHL